MSLFKSMLVGSILASSFSVSATSFSCKVSEDTDADMHMMRKVADVLKLKKDSLQDLAISQVTGALLTYQNLIRDEQLVIQEGEEAIVQVTDHLSNEISEYSILITKENERGDRVLKVNFPLSRYEGEVKEYTMSPSEIRRGFKIQNKFEEKNMGGGYLSPNKLGIEELFHIQTVNCRLK